MCVFSYLNLVHLAIRVSSYIHNYMSGQSDVAFLCTIAPSACSYLDMYNLNVVFNVASQI